jgi:hypothetical protein
MKFIKFLSDFFEGIITSICYLTAMIFYAGYTVEKTIDIVFSMMAKASVFLVLTAMLMAGMYFIDQLEPRWQTITLTSLVYGAATSFTSLITLYFWKREKFEKIFGLFKKNN